MSRNAVDVGLKNEDEKGEINEKCAPYTLLDSVSSCMQPQHKGDFRHTPSRIVGASEKKRE